MKTQKFHWESTMFTAKDIQQYLNIMNLAEDIQQYLNVMHQSHMYQF